MYVWLCLAFNKLERYLSIYLQDIMDVFFQFLPICFWVTIEAIYIHKRSINKKDEDSFIEEFPHFCLMNKT